MVFYSVTEWITSQVEYRRDKAHVTSPHPNPRSSLSVRKCLACSHETPGRIKATSCTFNSARNSFK